MYWPQKIKVMNQLANAYAHIQPSPLLFQLPDKEATAKKYQMK